MKHIHFYSYLCTFWLVALATPVLAATTPEPAKLDNIEFDAYVRFRYLAEKNFDFFKGPGSITNDADFAASVGQVGGLFKLNENNYIRLSAVYAGIWGGQPDSSSGLTTSQDRSNTQLDLHEVYLRTGNKGHGLTLGRQMIYFGDGFIFGRADWSNIGRSFDAARYDWQHTRNQLTVFYSFVTETNANERGNSSFSSSTGKHAETETMLMGLHNSFRVIKAMYLQPYFYYQYTDNPVFATDSQAIEGQKNRLYWAGGRLASKESDSQQAAGFNYALEFAAQFGRANNNTDYTGRAGHTDMGYGFKVSSMLLVAGASFNYASGDVNQNDDTNSRFQNLYNSYHRLLGHADIIGVSNVVGAGAFTGMYMKHLGLRLSYFRIYNDTPADVWARADGRLTGISTNGSHLFDEIDISLTVYVMPGIEVNGGGSFAWAGSGIAYKAAKQKFPTFYYLQTTGRFN